MKDLRELALGDDPVAGEAIRIMAQSWLLDVQQDLLDRAEELLPLELAAFIRHLGAARNGAAASWLLGRLRHASPLVRWESLEALAWIGDKRLRPELEEFTRRASGPDRELARAVAGALGSEDAPPGSVTDRVPEILPLRRGRLEIVHTPDSILSRIRCVRLLGALKRHPAIAGRMEEMYRERGAVPNLVRLTELLRTLGQEATIGPGVDSSALVWMHNYGRLAVPYVLMLATAIREGNLLIEIEENRLWFRAPSTTIAPAPRTGPPRA